MGGIIRSGARVLLKLVIGLVLVALLALAAFRLAAAYRERLPTPPPRETTLLRTTAGGIAVQLSGQPRGSPILLVGGTAGWSGFWRDVARHLAGRGFRVIAIDLPPFGFSGHDPAQRYDRVRQAERILAVLQATGDRPAILLGHSYGAGPALEAAVRAPGKIRRLVLVDAALGGFDMPPAPAPWLLHQQPIAEVAVAAGFTNPWAMRPSLRALLARKHAADAWIETLRRPMRRPGSTTAYAAWLPALFATDDGARSRRGAEVKALPVPVALIWGEADTVTPIAQGEEIARLARARIHRLPGIGHIPHIEDPARFLSALDAAIEDHP